MKLSKNINNKICAPKLIFFSEKKIEKDSDNFWYRKLTLKVKRLGDFALFDTSSLTKFLEFNNFLWVCWFLGKNLSNFVPPIWKLHNPYCHSGHESYKRWGKLFLGYNILSAVHWHIWDSLPPRIIEDFIKIRATDYGHPMKPFFHWNPELLEWGR